MLLLIIQFELMHRLETANIYYSQEALNLTAADSVTQRGGNYDELTGRFPKATTEAAYTGIQEEIPNQGIPGKFK